MFRVIVAEPHLMAVEREIDCELDTLRGLVGGWIEGVKVGQPGQCLLIYVNEEGVIAGLPYNRTIEGRAYVGTLILAKVDRAGNHISLSDNDVSHWLRQLNNNFC